jgi:mono/diheme cytochrome c family protein
MMRKGNILDYALKGILLFCLFLFLGGLDSCQPDDGDDGTTTTTSAATTTSVAPTTTTSIALTGDLVRGGTLYDKWWKVNDGDEPSSDHSYWASRPDTESNTRSGADTWRCKECHGWDYKGVDGAYGSGSHKTGFAGIYDNKDDSESELTASFSGGMMDFSDQLSEQDIADIVAFVRGGLIDESQYIDLSTKEANGDSSNGETLYSGSGQCAGCHGADGKTIDFGDGEGVGDLALDNPWETLHKIRFGHPGSAMPSAIKNGLTTDEQVDILTYCQALGDDTAPVE